MKRATFSLRRVLRIGGGEPQDSELAIKPAELAGLLLIEVGCNEFCVSVEEARAIAAALLAVAEENS